MLSIAQIATVVAANMLGQLSDADLRSAHDSVLIALDPVSFATASSRIAAGPATSTLIDLAVTERCGLDDDTLDDMEFQIWSEEVDRCKIAVGRATPKQAS